MMKFIFSISLLIVAFVCRSQTISPQVINSAGKHYPVGVNGVYFSDNIGEPFAATQGPSGNIMITEGFLQPFVITARINGEMTKSDISCIGKRDGAITVSVNCNIPNAKIRYCWDPVSICPDSTCSSKDSLKAGTYSVKVLVTYTIGGVVKTDTSITQTLLVQDMKYPCKIKVFNGVTPNNDGVNDVFFIENISEFPNNRVQIFNRWGKKIYDEEKYDNIKKAWPESNENDLLSSTYFYIIDLGDGSPLLKGWVELLRN